MKKGLLALMVAISALCIVVGDADARRLGGGGSYGRQSQNLSRQTPSYSPSYNYNQAAPQRPATPTPMPTQPRPASPWRGLLGGALVGLGLGALFSHFGLGGGMFGSLLTIVLLVLVVSFVLRLFRRGSDSSSPSYASGYSSGNGYTPEIGSRIEPTSSQPAAFQGQPAAGIAPWGVPADFDTAGFLRHAKTYFIRLQAAWDRADVNDIREFTSPEMFAELRMQIEERGATPNNTDVERLDAELLGIETVNSDYLASVKFSGLIKEEQNAPAQPFAEVWNLSKPQSGQGGWVLAGIQQLS
jgi:predicted lipid-binding transport protein (Tim44 family)